MTRNAGRGVYPRKGSPRSFRLPPGPFRSFLEATFLDAYFVLALFLVFLAWAIPWLCPNLQRP